MFPYKQEPLNEFLGHLRSIHFSDVDVLDLECDSVFPLIPRLSQKQPTIENITIAMQNNLTFIHFLLNFN